MGLTAKNKGAFELVPEDLHFAICYGIWDLGKQYNEKWDKSQHKVVIVWEIPGVRIELDRDGKKVNLPRAISRQFTLSLGAKSDLRKVLEGWRGKKFTDEELENGFDLKKLLGVPCQIQVLHAKVGENTYANVASVVKAPPGTKAKAENPLTFFSFEENMIIPDNTPEWIAKLIKESEEYKNQPEGLKIPDDGESAQDTPPF